MKKKGQAAVEFLMTYGWAILAVLITIGALAYFDVFNLSKYVDDMCDFGDQLKCEDHAIKTDGTVKFRLRNNFGVPITAFSNTSYISFEQKSFNCSVICGASEIPQPSCDIDPGKRLEVECLTNSFVKSQKIKLTAKINFTRQGGSNSHLISGDIYSSPN